MTHESELALIEPSPESDTELRASINAFFSEGRTHIPGLLPDGAIENSQAMPFENLA